MTNNPDIASKTIMLDTASLQQVGVGRLGAVAPEQFDRTMMLMVALDMAERRIMRMEMALRRAGIEPEAVELPE